MVRPHRGPNERWSNRGQLGLSWSSLVRHPKWGWNNIVGDIARDATDCDVAWRAVA